MEFDLSKPQSLLQESTREFLAHHCPLTRVRELIESETAHDSALWTEMVDQGWTGILLPEEVGGLGLGLVELAVVAEEMGRACCPGPLLATQWAAAVIASTQNRGIATDLLRGIAEGRVLATVALLEEPPSWDPADVALRAEADGAGLRLSGCKILVLNAAVADVIVCVARANEELIVAAVPAGSAGLTMRATAGLDESRKWYRIEFDGVYVAEDHVLAAGTAAAAAVSSGNHVGSILAAAELVGVMQWVLDTTVEYARTRQQFGRAIGSFQAVQHQCADMLLLTEGSRSATYYAAWVLNERDPSADRAVALAKAYCSDAAREVTNRGVQVHGGVGFTWEHDLHLFYRRAKSCELLFGDATFHRHRLARMVIDTAAAD